MSDIDPRAYGESRLGVDWSLTGVGFSWLGRAFSDWQYRLRVDRFESDAGKTLRAASFDIASCMDMMFHIVEHRRLRPMLSNIAEPLVAGGLYIWSGFFIHGREAADGR